MMGQDSISVNLSELRKGIDKILEKAKGKLIVVERRHRPVAVIMSTEEYRDIEEILKLAEDIVFGFIVRERFENSSGRDYIDIRNLLRLS